MSKYLNLAATIFLPFFFLGTAIAQSEPLRNTIDQEIKGAWVKEKIAIPDRSTDSVFLRRVYLDLIGMIPNYGEVTAFLMDTDPKKREKLVDNLLADPRFARNQSQLWDLNLLGRNPQNIGTSRNREAFQKWLAIQFKNNEPYDRIVHKVLIASEEDSHLFYAQFNGSADDTTTTVMRVFLGTQLQCAKCHDHPFDIWTQRDFYGMTSFFVRTVVVEISGSNNDKKYVVGEKSTGDVNFTISSKDAKPGAKKGGDPVKPKFLGGADLIEPELPKNFLEPKLKPKEIPPKPIFSRREKIVEWITAKENPYLARAAVNRIWAQFMGRGFVHPVDDFNPNNQPNLADLLKKMEIGFINSKFDIKWLIREIVNSSAYQVTEISSVADALPKFYERARVRPLAVEELMASLHVATGLGVESALKSVPSKDMLKYLGEPTDGQGTFQGSLSEHLFFHNGDTLRSVCQPRKGNLAENLLTSTDTWNAKIDRMFLSALSRMPTDMERDRFFSYLNPKEKELVDKKLPGQRLEEALWVLFSCSEFRFNR